MEVLINSLKNLNISKDVNEMFKNLSIDEKSKVFKIKINNVNEKNLIKYFKLYNKLRNNSNKYDVDFKYKDKIYKNIKKIKIDLIKNYFYIEFQKIYQSKNN